MERAFLNFLVFNFFLNKQETIEEKEMQAPVPTTVQQQPLPASCVAAHHISITGSADAKDVLIAFANIQSAMYQKFHDAFVINKAKPVELHCLAVFLDALSNQIRDYKVEIENQKLHNLGLK